MNKEKEKLQLITKALDEFDREPNMSSNEILETIKDIIRQ